MYVCTYIHTYLAHILGDGVRLQPTGSSKVPNSLILTRDRLGNTPADMESCGPLTGFKGFAPRTLAFVSFIRSMVLPE